MPREGDKVRFPEAGMHGATIGLKSTQEIDEAISKMNLALG
jgi:hypothetical protein